MVREKHIKSGLLFEVDFTHVFKDGRKIPVRAPKYNPSSKEQSDYNKRQAEKKFIRLVNANFDKTDILMHPTYEQRLAPETEEEARRDIVNYLRRMKTYRASETKRLKKYLLDNPSDARARKNLKKLEEPFKYIYVIEKTEYQTGEKAGSFNWHFHLFMTGCGDGDRDKAEDMWKKGIRTNADRFRPDKWGPESAARYMSKNPQGSKKFVCSHNLNKPISNNLKDGRLSPRQIEKLAKERIDDSCYWEKKYPGYRFLKCYEHKNPYNGYWYVSVVMYKTDETAPKWNIEEWITE